jgi:hypothetical protein
MKKYNIPYEYIELGIVKLTASFFVIECLKAKPKEVTGLRIVDIKNKLGNLYGVPAIRSALIKLVDQGVVERLPGRLFILK